MLLIEAAEIAHTPSHVALDAIYVRVLRMRIRIICSLGITF